MAKFITQEGEVEIIRAVKKHQTHDQKTHAGGRGGGAVVSYDSTKDKTLLAFMDATREEQRALEKKYGELSPLLSFR